MSTNLAYTINVKPTNPDGSNADSFQSTPGWMLCFLGFSVPSPIDLPPSAQQRNAGKANARHLSDPTEVNNPIIVTSDCIALSVTQAKEDHNPSFQATLLGGKYNYLATIFPGDYVTINMSHDESKMTTLGLSAQSLSPVNKINQGFKGVFRVVSVREAIQLDPVSGKRRLTYTVSGVAFSELNNIVYFNPYITPTEASDLFYMSEAFGTIYTNNKNNLKDAIPLQQMVGLILGVGLGKGVNGDSKVPLSPNTFFKVSGALASLMGTPTAQSFRDFYRFYFGIQDYDPSVQLPANSVLGTIPKVKPKSHQTYNSHASINGQSLINVEFWNQVSVWSIISQYTNSPINEMFTQFKVVPENGGMIMPCLTYRQTPFSSLKLENDNPNENITTFLTLPRWNIDPSMIRSMNTGRDDALRTNFVQIFGVPQAIDQPQRVVIGQLAKNSSVAVDKDDIIRSGLKPQVITSHFDVERGTATFYSPWWSRLVGDATIGSHMKLSGSIDCVGIEQDITVGDNLQIGTIVYHIESIVHQGAINQNGARVFTTTINFTQGVDDSTEDQFKVYGQTINQMYGAEQTVDYNSGLNILPAVVNDSSDAKSLTGIPVQGVLPLPSTIGFTNS